MDDLKPYAVFATTVEAGSMSAAARRLGMSPSAVSQIIRALEKQAGVTLLHRSTRKLALSEAGERCYPHCRRLLDAAQSAGESLVLARDAPSGELRLAAPVGFALHIAPALAPVLAQAPQLRLRLLVDDALIDLIDARIDIAIRVGRLADSNWLARPLCHLGIILCAAPHYLERHGAPGSPDELTQHHWLALARDATELPLDVAEQRGDRLPTLSMDLFHAKEGSRRVQVGVRVASNNQLALQHMCEEGLGLARLSYADVQSSLASGALVRVLPTWSLKSLPVTAITPQREGEPAKVRVTIDALKRYFAALPGIPVSQGASMSIGDVRSSSSSSELSD